MLISVDDRKLRELQNALKRKDRRAVNNWLYKETKGRIVRIDESIFEGWIYLTHYPFQAFKVQILEVLTKLK